MVWPSVIVRHGEENALEGLEVTFAVDSAGGSVDPTSAVTDEHGIAANFLDAGELIDPAKDELSLPSAKT